MSNSIFLPSLIAVLAIAFAIFRVVRRRRDQSETGAREFSFGKWIVQVLALNCFFAVGTFIAPDAVLTTALIAFSSSIPICLIMILIRIFRRSYTKKELIAAGTLPILALTFVVTSYSLNRIANQFLRERKIQEIPNLTHQLSSRVSQSRWSAAADLMELGPKAAPASSALVELLGDPEMTVRTRTHKALIAIGHAAIPALQEGLLNPNFHVRQEAREILKELGAAPETSIEEEQQRFLGKQIRITLFSILESKPSWSEGEFENIVFEGSGYATANGANALFSADNPGIIKVHARSWVNGALQPYIEMIAEAQKGGRKTYFDGLGVIVGSNEVRIEQPGICASGLLLQKR